MAPELPEIWISFGNPCLFSIFRVSFTHHAGNSSRSVYFSSMSVVCVMASILPIILEKLDVDQAISTGPFVTTFIDIVGVASYFFIAITLLPA